MVYIRPLPNALGLIALHMSRDQVELLQLKILYKIQAITDFLCNNKPPIGQLDRNLHPIRVVKYQRQVVDRIPTCKLLLPLDGVISTVEGYLRLPAGCFSLLAAYSSHHKCRFCNI